MPVLKRAQPRAAQAFVVLAYSPGAAAALHAHSQDGYFVSAPKVSAPPYGRWVAPARFAYVTARSGSEQFIAGAGV